MSLLVLNAGSSTVKYALFSTGDLRRESQGMLEHDGSAEDFQACLGVLLKTAAKGVEAVGHRVVHGGAAYSAPLRIDAEVMATLRDLVALAPLHQPHNLAGIDAVAKLLPDIPQVACFDTAFHRSQPELLQRYGLPRRFFDAGIRRYGFHGLSYESIVEVLPENLKRARVIVAHLGNGASACAIKEGKSVATTMGFSTLDGLIMGTRCGSIDPGVLLYLTQHDGMTADQISELLYRQSGLLGVSGKSGDMRTLLASDTPAAKEAVELFCDRVRREIASLAGALGGVDALVFTGGIGEHAPDIRQRICDGLAWLALQDDNILTLPCNEEKVIANHVRRLVTSA